MLIIEESGLFGNMRAEDRVVGDDSCMMSSPAARAPATSSPVLRCSHTFTARETTTVRRFREHGREPSLAE